MVPMPSTFTADDYPQRRFTAVEILAMLESGALADDEPLELLDGRLVVVSPQGPAHSGLVVRLRRSLEAAYGPAFSARDHSPLDCGESSWPEPDIALVPSAADDYLGAHPHGIDAVLVIEIAVTSRDIDRAKAAIYCAAGVPEYWLVDVQARRLEVRTTPIPDHGAYALTRILDEEETLLLPGLTPEVRWTVRSLLP